MADGGNNTQEDDEVPGRVVGILCQTCLSKDQKTVANTFCSTCNEFQCIDCSDVHNVLAVFKSHKLLNANVAHVIRCDQHQKVLDFFCEDESKLCCSTCAIVDHRKCQSIVEVEKISGTMTTLSSNLEEILQEAKEDAEDIKRHIRSSKDQLAQDVQEIQANIKEMRYKVVRMFKQLEVSIVKRAKYFQRETLLNLEKKQSQNEKHVDNVTAYLETIHSIYKNGITTEKFIAEQKMGLEVKTLCRNVKEECQSLEMATISFEWDEQLKLPPQPFNEYIPGQITVKYNLLEKVNAVNNIKTLTPVASIYQETDNITLNPLYLGTDFLPDGRLVAVDHYNKEFLVYNEKLEKEGSYQLSYQPLSVVAVSEDEVAITSGGQYEIEFLNVSKCSKITVDKTCKVKTKFDSICLKDDRQFVVGVFDDQRPVRIVSLTGEEKYFSINFPNKKYYTFSFACTYIRNSNKVVLTDRFEHTVYIYDVKTNTRVVVKDRQIKQPYGVTVGPSDTILVCSENTNSIVQISQTGRILSSYKIDMINPFKVCVSRDNSILAVTNCRWGKVNLRTFKFS